MELESSPIFRQFGFEPLRVMDQQPADLHFFTMIVIKSEFCRYGETV